MRAIMAVLLALAILVPVAGCGRKGPPQLPEGQSDRYPRTYPSE